MKYDSSIDEKMTFKGFGREATAAPRTAVPNLIKVLRGELLRYFYFVSENPSPRVGNHQPTSRPAARGFAAACRRSPAPPRVPHRTGGSVARGPARLRALGRPDPRLSRPWAAGRAVGPARVAESPCGPRQCSGFLIPLRTSLRQARAGPCVKTKLRWQY